MSSSSSPDIELCRAIEESDRSIQLNIWQPGEILQRSRPWHCVFLHLTQVAHDMIEQLLALAGQWPTVILTSQDTLEMLGKYEFEGLCTDELENGRVDVGDLSAAMQAAIFKHKLHHLQQDRDTGAMRVMDREVFFQRSHDILVLDRRPSYLQVVQCRWINVANGEVSWQDVQALKTSFNEFITNNMPQEMISGRILDDKIAFLSIDHAQLDGDWLKEFQMQCEQEFKHLRVAFYKSSPVLLTDGESLSLGLQQAVQQIARDRLEQEAKFEWPSYQEATHGVADSLHVALQNQQFFLEYQPQVNTQTDEWVGVEVLMRWKHPTLGIIPPTAFIKEAENIGLLPVLGRWSLHEAMRAWGVIKAATGREVRVSVNVAFQQITEMDFAMDVMEALAANDMPANCLELEITETSMIKDEMVSKENLKYLLDAGVHVSLDDFGTGYSSLSHLIDLPITGIKIDRAFITSLDTNTTQFHISQSMVELAQKLELETTAEGIEDMRCMQQAKKLNCDRLQGYYISRPLSLEKLLEFAEELTDSNYMVK